MPPLKSGENPSNLFHLLVAPGVLWLLPHHSNLCLCLCASLCFLPFLQGYPLLDLGPTWNPGWFHLKILNWASLVAQWSRIHLPMQQTQVPFLVWEDPTCRAATDPVHHDYWACALKPGSHKYWSPHALELVLCNKRSHHNEKPVHHS